MSFEMSTSDGVEVALDRQILRDGVALYVTQDDVMVTVDLTRGDVLDLTRALLSALQDLEA